MKIDAALVKKQGIIQMETLDLADPEKDEVLIRIVATGICHTDLSIANQDMASPLPIALGHEGAGVVENVGPGVTEFEKGDHVIVTFAVCNECKPCLTGHTGACEQYGPLNFEGTMRDGTTRLSQDGKMIHNFFGQSSLSTYAISHQSNIIKVDKDIDLSILGPLGCGIQTGAGTVLNKLKPEFGSSLTVFGTGGVGLSGIMAAHIVGCSQVIAVDINNERLELAKELGATHTINSKEEKDVAGKIQEITNGGSTYAFDTTGIPSVINQGIKCLAVEGEIAVVAVGDNVEIDVLNDLVMQNRTITGVTQGLSVPKVFLPQLIQYYKDGRFPFDKLIKKYPISELDQALEDMKSGKTIKPVILFE